MIYLLLWRCLFWDILYTIYMHCVQSEIMRIEHRFNCKVSQTKRSCLDWILVSFSADYKPKGIGNQPLKKLCSAICVFTQLIYHIILDILVIYILWYQLFFSAVKNRDRLRYFWLTIKCGSFATALEAQIKIRYRCILEMKSFLVKFRLWNSYILTFHVINQ